MRDLFMHNTAPTPRVLCFPVCFPGWMTRRDTREHVCAGVRKSRFLEVRVSRERGTCVPPPAAHACASDQEGDRNCYSRE